MKWESRRLKKYFSKKLAFGKKVLYNNKDIIERESGNKFHSLVVIKQKRSTYGKYWGKSRGSLKK